MLKSTKIAKPDVVHVPTIPDHFICPISLEIMKEPVICSDGNTYDRKEISRWLLNNNTSPKTNLILDSKNLIPNYAVPSGIEKLVGFKNEDTADMMGAVKLNDLEDNKIQVYVKTITNESISLCISKDAIVLSLMHEIAAKQGVPVNQQRLIHAGKQMDANRRLKRYGIRSGAVIHLVLRLVGGTNESA